MRLCIADPPYLGRAHKWYGDNPLKSFNEKKARATGVLVSASADTHPEAHVWDDPETHRQLVERLCAEYDGWAIAMVPANLFDYLQWVPRKKTHIAVWHRPSAPPGNGRLHTKWEPVLVRVPEGRRHAIPGHVQGDVLTANRGQGFVGAKPRAWTRWVLDMLGYQPDTDTVDDLFHGSGAVAAEINQTILNLEWSRQS